MKKCTIEDRGMITARTNVDCTTTNLIVKCKCSLMRYSLHKHLLALHLHEFKPRNIGSDSPPDLDFTAGHNNFIQRLCDTAECSEHCPMEFSVKVRDVTAPVNFFIDKYIKE